MIMMLIRVPGASLQPRRAAVKGVALEHPELRKLLDSSIDGRERDLRIYADGPPVHLIDVRVVVGFVEHSCDDQSLPCHPQTPVSTQPLKLGAVAGVRICPFRSRTRDLGRPMFRGRAGLAVYNHRDPTLQLQTISKKVDSLQAC